MGKTSDIDLHSPIPISQLKLDPPPSEAARETWRKIVAETPAGPVTAVVTDPKDIAALKQGAAPDVSMSSTSTISFADFEKVDLRVGRVVAAGPVPKSNKLLRLEVSFGGLGNRIILSGIAKAFPDPQVLVGNHFVFVVNLAPRPMMGMESHGMLLSAQDSEGGLIPISCSGCEGSRVG